MTFDKDTPLWMLTVEQFLELANSINQKKKQNQSHK